MKPNLTEAIDFLQRFYPDGAWILSSIPLKGDKIEAKTFYPGEEDHLKEWVREKQINKCNMYFQVNPSSGMDLEKKDRRFKKASRTDIAGLKVLHVDLDPRAGEDLVTEQELIRTLASNPPAGLPAPSISIWSGGGVQLLWLLDEMVESDGTIPAAEELKLYNLQIERVYGGYADHCHNIDRILRLPGTCNFPNEIKRKKGRIPSMSKVLEYHKKRVYPISEFTKAPKIQGSLGLDNSGAKVIVDVSNTKRVDLADYEESIKGWVRSMIVQGYDPNGSNDHLIAFGEDPHKYDSRSEALWMVVCQMVKANVKDEVIYSIITDPDYKISEHVLSQKGDIERYAIRQIKKAKEQAIEPLLCTLNEKHAVIGDVGGKCRIVSEVFDPAMNRSKMSLQSFADFSNRYCNQKVQVGEKKDGSPIMMPAGKWWIDHELRRQYDTITFAPGREVEGAYNMWAGFTCEATKGECYLYLDHIKENVCGGNIEYYNYLLDWMARTVQQPGKTGEVAVVLRGRQGTGKGVFIKTFGSLFGRHFLQVSDAKHMTGAFNAHLRDCVVLFGDEAFYAGDKRHESTLKGLITEDTMSVEQKGVDVFSAGNFLHIMMASNSTWVVPADVNERRFFVLDVQATRIQDTEYFENIKKQMKNGGKEALLYYLLNRDISKFTVQQFPRTGALQEQKMESMSGELEWWYNCLDEGVLIDGVDGWAGGMVGKEILHSEYISYLEKIKYKKAPLNYLLFCKFIKTMCPDEFLHHKQFTNGGARTYCFQFPSQTDARKHFDERYGGPFPWAPLLSTKVMSPQQGEMV